MALHAQRAANMRYRDQCFKDGQEMLAIPYPKQGIDPERYCLFCAKALEEVEMDRNIRQNSRGVFHPCKCQFTERFGGLEIDSNRQGATPVSDSFWLVETLAEGIEFFQSRKETTRHLAMPPAAESQETPSGAGIPHWPLTRTGRFHEVRRYTTPTGKNSVSPEDL